MKKLLKLTRFTSGNEGTFGRLKLTEDLILYTAELPYKDNKPYVSCIPTGDYRLSCYSSAKYPNAFEVLDVPDRTHILIHTGNWVGGVWGMRCDSKGCILPGTSFGLLREQCAVLSSRSAFSMLSHQVTEWLGDGNEVWISIR